MQHISVNGTNYKFNCYFAKMKRKPDSNGKGNIISDLGIQVWNVDENKQLFWQDVQENSELLQKIEECIENLIGA